jgi:hypothetical protein
MDNSNSIFTAKETSASAKVSLHIRFEAIENGSKSTENNSINHSKNIKKLLKI